MRRKRNSTRAKYVYSVGPCHPCTAIYPDGTTEVFPSRMEANRQKAPFVPYNDFRVAVNNCCSGKAETAFGCRWRNEKVEFFPDGTKAAAKREAARRGAGNGNLEGRRYGRITVTRRVFVTLAGEALYSCRCDCGSKRIFRGSELEKGTVRSCGCMDSIALLEEAMREFDEVERLKRIIAAGFEEQDELEKEFF